MSLKWTGSNNDSGILRKSEFREKKEELLVFGYSCKLFRDDERALQIDQGKHLIPWMGDDTLKIDRYDARGALHDLSTLEAPPGGYDWRVELTRGELDVEQICDEERYRALHTDEDEEEMYKEEELKRLHAAGYGQVGFNYDIPSAPEQTVQQIEVDEPFVPSASFKALLPQDIVLPDSLKQNAIIEKTAKFIASQGAQMEILIKAKQGDNPQFLFLNRDNILHPYYLAYIGLVKAGKWPEKKPEEFEEKTLEPEEYLHPSLASTVIELAPSIPSIHYKPSADCDYTMLISKMRGEATLDEVYPPELAPGEVAPPGTEPLPPRPAAEISRAPVMYNRTGNQEKQQSHQYAAYYHQYMAQTQAAKPPAPPTPKKNPPSILPSKSTGLSLMKNYNTDSDSDASGSEDSILNDNKRGPKIITPPQEVQVVIDKMAAYVARNGDEFAEIVRAKNDPRFTFLEPSNEYHAYYNMLMQRKRGLNVNGRPHEEKSSAPVSFSIKKHKEPDPILPKPALPYESSSDEESEKTADKPTDEQKTQKSTSISYAIANVPPVLVYKMEATQENNLPLVKTIEAVPKVAKVKPDVVKPAVMPEIKQVVLVEEKAVECSKKEASRNIFKNDTSELKTKSPTPETHKEEKLRGRTPEIRREKRKHKDRKKEYKSKSDKESKKAEKRSSDKEKKRDRNKEKRKKYSQEKLETEIISLEDNSDDLIDLTGEHSDTKEGETEEDRSKQQSRRRRAAEFLKKVGVDPSTVALPTSSLASAMVDTLESLHKRKAHEEEKQKRKEKRKRKEKYDYRNESEKSHRKSKRRKYRSSDDEELADCSKRKKGKKEKKHSSKNKKKIRETEAEERSMPLNIDLSNTLKVLRTSSPTKELGLEDIEGTQPNVVKRRDSSSDLDSERESELKNSELKKKNREYSEGEWSSDSEEDSRSSCVKAE